MYAGKALIELSVGAPVGRFENVFEDMHLVGTRGRTVMEPHQVSL